MECEPDAGVFEAVKEYQRDGDDDETEVVVVDRIEERDVDESDVDVRKRGDQLDALRAAEGFPEPLPAEPDDLPRRERPDEEVERLHPEEGEAEGVGGEGGDGGSERHCEGYGNPQPLREQRARIGADSGDYHVGERPFAGEGEEPVAHHHQDVDDQEDRDLLLGEAEQVGKDDEAREDQGENRPVSPAATRASTTEVPSPTRSRIRSPTPLLSPVPGPRAVRSAAR